MNPARSYEDGSTANKHAISVISEYRMRRSLKGGLRG